MGFENKKTNEMKKMYACGKQGFNPLLGSHQKIFKINIHCFSA